MRWGACCCRVKDEGKLTIAVAGPAVVHTGRPTTWPAWSRWATWVSSSVATPWPRTTSRPLCSAPAWASPWKRARPCPAATSIDLRAINTIRRCGAFAARRRAGVLDQRPHVHLRQDGHAFVLAGSIRDDGPLPEVITDIVAAQKAMRAYAQRAGACLMLSTMLHSIAVGNLLPASVRTVCVDINPAVVTKLADRGSFQTDRHRHRRGPVRGAARARAGARLRVGAEAGGGRCDGPPPPAYLALSPLTS